MRTMSNEQERKIVYDGAGLVPVVVVDSDLYGNMSLGGLLMLAYADNSAIRATRETGLATFWSRKRKQQWIKGETSGSYLYLRNMYVDCDADTVVYDVIAPVATCHTGAFSCFELPTIGELM